LFFGGAKAFREHLLATPKILHIDFIAPVGKNLGLADEHKRNHLSGCDVFLIEYAKINAVKPPFYQKVGKRHYFLNDH
jgi:hypothetical protein